jgi:2-keto-4-pentenoate hydratase
MTPAAREQAAKWLAEAFETGNPLGPLPPEVSPRSVVDGQRVAALVLDILGITPCGVRVAPGPGGKPVAGPMLEGRLLAASTKLTLGALPHARATAAIVAVLEEELPRRGGGLPPIRGLHPAIDIAASRFRDAPSSGAMLSADLGGLGQVVAGKLGRLPEAAVPVTLAPAGKRPRGLPQDLLDALDLAAEAARRLGGLPPGALLIVAGLSPALQPVAGEDLSAAFGPLGRVNAQFA